MKKNYPIIILSGILVIVLVKVLLVDNFKPVDNFEKVVFTEEVINYWSISYDLIRRVANSVIGEAAGEGRQGQVAVACALRNRINAGMSLSCYGEQRQQFINSQIPYIGDQVEEIIEDVFYNQIEDVTNGALYFENVELYGWPKWTKKCKVEITYEYRNHVFYKAELK